jgi:hypothetical protein
MFFLTKKTSIFVNTVAHFPHSSLMSPAVLQLFPTPPAHVAGFLYPCTTISFRKKSSTTEFKVQTQNSVMIKEKEQQLPFTNGEENVPPRVQKRSAC